MEKNMSSSKDKVTLKVIILYICEQIDSLSEQELMQIVLETMYMDYFTFSKLLGELIDEDLLSAAIRKDESHKNNPPKRFSLTNKGAVVLETLNDNIPHAMTKYIQEVIAQKNSDKKSSESVVSTFEITANATFKLNLELKEQNETYFKLQFNVPNQGMAKKISENWEKNAGKIYPQILNLLNEQDNQEV